MFVPRRHFTVIANVDTDVFKTLQRRDQVPLFRRTTSEMFFGTDEEREAFNEAQDSEGYSIFEAVLLATADRLALEASFSRDVARRVVEGHWHTLIDVIRLVESGKEAWFAAYSEGHSEEADEFKIEAKVSSRMFFVEVGSLGEVVEKIQAEWKETDHEGRAICLLNMTPIIRRSQAAAKHLGYSGSLLG